MVRLLESTVGKKRLYILPQYLANQTKPTRYTERYGLMAVVPTLTALLLSSLNDALSEFSCAKHLGKCTGRHLFAHGGLTFIRILTKCG